LYYRDTRFLDGLTLRVNGHTLVALDAAHLSGHEAAVDLVNREFADALGRDVPQHTLSVRRERRLSGLVIHEHVRASNFSTSAVTLDVEIRFRCRFEDIFVVKRFVGRPQVDEPRSSIEGSAHVVWQYRGVDNVRRQTHLAFDPVPQRLEHDRALFRVDLAPRTSHCIALAITPAIGSDGRSPGRPRPLDRLDGKLDKAERIWLESTTAVRSSSDLFDRVFWRGVRDLRVLRSRVGREHYFAAGVPWFATLFGRDAAIVAMQMLPYGARVARETLALLARYRALYFDTYRDAEPGKILHELRRGELAEAGEIPQSPAYYGSIDATLLFITLFAEYARWSGDIGFVSRHREALDAAVAWMMRRMDLDRDGYIAYRGRYATGLINQGWKDSGNAIVDERGELAEPPIALAEVQGYAFRACRDAAMLLRALEEPDDAAALDARADALKVRFDRDFWCDAIDCYALGRHRRGRLLAVATSNAGQVLWSGIALPARSRMVAARLLQADMFSGWGIRTLSTRERAYNAVSYHRGSVWPHDNGLILAGFRRCGFDAAAMRVFDAILDAAIEFRGRLPELFCGFARRPDESPVPYPASSSPQAWAAGALPHGLWNLLGLRPNAFERRLRVVRPTLPDRLERLVLSELRVGDSIVDLHFERRHGSIEVDAEVRDGQLEIDVTRTTLPLDEWE
jgi:glycogen debranching enzyme